MHRYEAAARRGGVDDRRGVGRGGRAVQLWREARDACARADEPLLAVPRHRRPGADAGQIGDEARRRERTQVAIETRDYETIEHAEILECDEQLAAVPRDRGLGLAAA